MSVFFRQRRKLFRWTRYARARPSSFSTQSLTATPPSPDLWMEPIHVLGAGSMGLLMAASLRVAFPAYPIRLLLREHHRVHPGQDQPEVLVNLIQKRRLRTVPVPSQIIPSSHPRKPYRNVIVTTKAYQAISALESIRPCLQLTPTFLDTKIPPTQIVLLCNGALAVREEILARFPEMDPSQLHLALTTHGAYRDTVTTELSERESSYESANESDSLMMDVIHAGMGRLDFPAALARWTPLFDRAGLQAQTLPNETMETQVWHKLAANCLINPLTALHQCKNGELVDLPEWSHYLKTVPEEVARVASLSVGNESPLEIYASSLRNFCQVVVEATRDNRSSMLQDVNGGRKTEIDALNGYIIRLGKELNIPVPANSDLYERVTKQTEHTTG